MAPEIGAPRLVERLDELVLAVRQAHVGTVAAFQIMFVVESADEDHRISGGRVRAGFCHGLVTQFARAIHVFGIGTLGILKAFLLPAFVLVDLFGVVAERVFDFDVAAELAVEAEHVLVVLQVESFEPPHHLARSGGVVVGERVDDQVVERVHADQREHGQHEDVEDVVDFLTRGAAH